MFIRESLDIEWWGIMWILLAVLITSFSRIRLGVHYPSDCFTGFLQGVLASVIGSFLYHKGAIGCGDCRINECYIDKNDTSAITVLTFKTNFDFLLFFGLFVAVILITIIAIIRPLHLWDKCDHVFGMLFPCLIFRFTFLCYPLNKQKSALPEPSDWEWYSVVLGLVVVAIATFVGVKSKKGHFQLWVFIALFISLYSILAVWRLYFIL